MIIYNSETVQITTNAQGPSDNIVICFQAFIPKPGFHNEPFGHHFIEQLGLRGMFVNVSANHWYQSPDFAAAIPLLREACEGSRVITYGSSMGAYAALLYSRALGAETVLAVGPQLSIDPIKVPFEPRWVDEAAQLKFDWDNMEAGISPTANILLVYDSATLDARHARLIEGLGPNVKLIPVPFGGHPVLGMLVESKAMNPIFESVVAGTATPRSISALIKERRRESCIYWSRLGMRAARRDPRHAAAALDRIETMTVQPRAKPHVHELQQIVFQNDPSRREMMRDKLRERLSDAQRALTIDMTLASAPGLMTGWSGPEPAGRWMVGDFSTLDLPGSLSSAPFLLELHIRRAFGNQELVLSCGEEQLYRGRPAAGVVSALVDLARSSEKITLSMLHPDATSPFAIGNSNDKRRLSFFVERIVCRHE